MGERILLFGILLLGVLGGSFVATSDDPCDTRLNNLVASSNLQEIHVLEEGEKLVPRLSEVEDGHVFIQLYLEGTSVPMGWLDLDIETKELVDISWDDENPVVLSYDTLLCEAYIGHCLK